MSWALAWPAAAFVPTRTEGATGIPLYWKKSCVPVTIYLGDFEAKSHLTATAIAKSVAAAAHAWSPEAVTCPDGEPRPFLEIVPTLAPAGATAPAVTDDAKNIVVFRTESWTLDGAIDGDPLLADTLAYTHVTHRPDGHIVDADILINGSQAWRNFDPGETPSPDRTVREYDLQAVLTHEFGHFLGFAHTCVRPGEFDVPQEDAGGHVVPECGVADGSITPSVMYIDTAEDDTTKRKLTADDELAVCRTYPAHSDPKICEVDAPYDGCVVAPARSRRGLGAGLLAALGATVIAAWRRRRARA